MDLGCGILCCRVDLDMVFQYAAESGNPKPKVSAPSPGVLKQYKDALRRMR